MSSPEYRLVLSPLAEQDIENILRYTGETWGEGQMRAYSDKLNAALQAIRFNPWIGHKSADLPDTHRLYPVGSHVIVYRVARTPYRSCACPA
jgi:toxin ParE1/3/4